MGPDDSSATAASKTAATGTWRSEWPGTPRGLGKEDEITEAPIQAKKAEVARFTPTWQGPVAENHRELSAGRCLGGRLLTLTFVLVSQPVLTRSTHVVAWPQGDQILGGGHVTHGAKAGPQNPETHKTKKIPSTWEEKKKDRRRNHLILVGNPPGAQVVP